MGVQKVSEQLFRITSLLVVFVLVFAFRAWADEAENGETQTKKTHTEMDRAMNLADEVQALNRGDFDSHRGPFHPNRQFLLQETTLSLSVKQN